MPIVSLTDEELQTEHKRFFDSIWALCLRPGIYTVESTANEIWSYINGLEHGGYRFWEDMRRCPLHGFAEWLARTYKLECQGDFWMWLVHCHKEHFDRLSAEQIWELMLRFYQFKYGTPYEPVRIIPCGHGCH